jgi:uncharacterized protein involved in exopolysaccharide biosynthesis
MKPEQKNTVDLTIRRNEAPERLNVTLRDALTPLFRQKHLVTMIFIGIFAGAILSALLLPPKYEAEMKILVNQDRVDPVITSDADIQRGSTAVSAVSEEDLNSEVELLKSRDLLERVVLASGLQSLDEPRWRKTFERFENALWRTPSSPQTELARSVRALEETLVVDPLKKTKLIRVMYSSDDPELAARVLQNLGNLFQEKHAAVHRPPGTLPFFNQEAERYRNELAAAEAQLTDFDGTEGVVSAAAQKQLVLQQLSQFEAELQQSEANAHEANQRALALKSQSANPPYRQTTQIIKTDNAQLIATLETTLLDLKLKRSDMLAKYAPTYQPVLELESQIADTQEAINQAELSPTQQVTTDRLPAQDWIATEVARAETDRVAFQAQAGAMGGVVRLYQGIAKNLDEKGRRQDDLIRNVKIGEDNYLLYLRKREEARISDALDSKRIVNVAIAEAATVPALPALSILWLLVGGFFTAGIVSVAAAYAVDRMDQRFRTPDELVRYLNVRVLASIPSRVLDK